MNLIKAQEYKNKLNETEKNYNEKLINALNNNEDPSILFNDLKILKALYKRKIKYYS